MELLRFLRSRSRLIVSFLILLIKYIVLRDELVDSVLQVLIKALFSHLCLFFVLKNDKKSDQNSRTNQEYH